MMRTQIDLAHAVLAMTPLAAGETGAVHTESHVESGNAQPLDAERAPRTVVIEDAVVAEAFFENAG